MQQNLHNVWSSVNVLSILNYMTAGHYIIIINTNVLTVTIQFSVIVLTQVYHHIAKGHITIIVIYHCRITIIRMIQGLTNHADEDALHAE